MTLDAIRSDLIAAPHGFFTRAGGASSGLYEGLNAGLGSRDQRGAVQMNRERVAAHLGVAPDHLHGVHQVHSADVVRVDGPLGEPRPKADALVTDRPGEALAILTADCQPVLFEDREAGVIGAAHAGWKGALGGVLEATLEAMEALGARTIRAAIGPSISQRNYEVGPEMLDAFLAEDAEAARFFANGEGDRMMLDLPGYGLHRLRRAGVEAEWTGHCTYADEARFYSYRRATHRGEPDYGRLIAAIRL
ncbi:peptidoglycan editing factor PgeF [Jannaschia sp. W003]|uniref:peptidoglycan editing factor PgeF n=1 Tax=Jannaschia sp. W003 TaxID=2867012 RepID=UPI0021A498C8|nr:peptidoglycan editing factor PgeF [Jannaschia sp. W003]UWQ22668.1 peptidoglycan editing factor PgeF [Jannaschia sp. W003]